MDRPALASKKQTVVGVRLHDALKAICDGSPMHQLYQGVKRAQSTPRARPLLHARPYGTPKLLLFHQGLTQRSHSRITPLFYRCEDGSHMYHHEMQLIAPHGPGEQS